MKFIGKYFKEVVLIGLILSVFGVWIAVYARTPSKSLRVYFLDVGQGDAIFIETPSKKQVLIDGGKNKKILSLLGRYMPFGDRSIDIVIGTHPDLDHVGGLIPVRERYKIGLELDQITARRGQVIDFGDGSKLIILFPNQDVSNWETNDGSVVAKLEYSNSSFLFTGDATIKTENILINLNKGVLDSDVLKAGHHGSRTSTSLDFAESVSPEYAIISAGLNNSYGHPHQEALNILEKVAAKVLSTAELGTIKFQTDGEKLEIK